MDSPNIGDLLLQSLEQESGNALVYRAALRNALREDLREEWTRYLAKTEMRVIALTQLAARLRIHLDVPCSGSSFVRELSAFLVRSMDTAKKTGRPAAAQVIACECVALAEARGHADWELIAEVAREFPVGVSDLLQQIYDENKDDRDEHFFHTKGWCRELRFHALTSEHVSPRHAVTEPCT